jgi:predicted ATPase
MLRRYAPMWLVQLPGLASDGELERVQRQVQGATQARMIRELADAVDMLTADTPLVLVLEDLHWSDSSTVECLAYLAQRREPARLLVLGTYRPVETVIQAHPLRGLVQELSGRGQCVELRLECLTAEDVAAYVVGRLGGPVTAALAAFVHERTEGNALFMVNIVEHLMQRG